MTFCAYCKSSDHDRSMCSDEALSNLRAKLTGNAAGYQIGEGMVTFTRLDGKQVKIDHVDYDSISNVATNNGVISLNKFDSNEIIHVPFVAYWTISY